MPSPDKELERRQKEINDAIATLRGTFDAIIIMATWQTEDGETATVQAADGNWHAQTGMIHQIFHKRAEEAACEKREQWAMQHPIDDEAEE